MSDYQLYRAATGEYDVSLHFVFEWNREKDWNFHQYNIPVTTVWYILEGTRRLVLANEEYLVEPGSIVVLPSGDKVTTNYVDGQIEPIIYLSMGIQAFIGGIEWYGLFGVPVVMPVQEDQRTEALRNLWLEILKDYSLISQQQLKLSASQAAFALRLEANTKYWLSLLIQLAQPFMETPSPASDKRVREVCTYIRDHYAASLSSEELASAVCLSEGHMRELFRRYMLMSPHQYITEVRMEKAKEFLGTTMLSLAEIAERVGFDDVSYFIHTFRKREGMTPAVYRRSLYPWKAN